MIIKSLCLEGFRNLEAAMKIEFDPYINIFIGENGSGKTSLLESIYWLALGKSFKTNKIDNIINVHKDYTHVTAIYTNIANEQCIKVNSYKQRGKDKINKIGEVLAKNLELIELAPTQLINEDTSGLIFKNSEIRRKFIDWLAFYANHHYRALWRDFHKLLLHRNTMLKQLKRSYSHKILQMLQYWDRFFIASSLKLDAIRKKIWDQFNYELKIQLLHLKFQEQILVDLEFFSGWHNDLAEALSKDLSIDLGFGYTHSGPHKADLKFIINNSVAKEILSRGQAKLLALAMMLARTKFIHKINNDIDFASVILIDDLAAELDDRNIQLIIEELRNSTQNVQIFITGIDHYKISKLFSNCNPKWFNLQQGKIYAN